MSIDRPEQTPQMLNVPLQFHAQNNNHSSSASPFNDTQYKVRLIRYTASIKSLLNTPPPLKSACSVDEIHHEKVNNYIWVVNELIKEIHELNHSA